MKRIYVSKLERDFPSIKWKDTFSRQIPLNFSLRIVEIKFSSKVDEQCYVSKIVRTFLLIYIGKNFEKIMVEEIFNQYKYIFYSQKKRQILVVKFKYILL